MASNKKYKKIKKASKLFTSDVPQNEEQSDFGIQLQIVGDMRDMILDAIPNDVYQELMMRVAHFAASEINEALLAHADFYEEKGAVK